MVRRGLPALLQELAEAVDGFEHGGGAGVGIDGAVDPGVAMVAGDDPVVLLGGVGAGDGADDVPDGAEAGVLLEIHVDGDGGGAAEVVGEGQAALPVVRGGRAGEGAEDGRGVLVGERVGGDGGLVCTWSCWSAPRSCALSRVGRAWRRCRGCWGRRGRWGGTGRSRAGRRTRGAWGRRDRCRRWCSRRRRGRSR